MFERFRRIKEHVGAFTECVRVYPQLFTKEGRESLVEDLLLIGMMHPAFLEEMTVYARRFIKMQDDLRPEPLLQSDVDSHPKHESFGETPPNGEPGKAETIFVFGD